MKKVHEGETIECTRKGERKTRDLEASVIVTL